MTGSCQDCSQKQSKSPTSIFLRHSSRHHQHHHHSHSNKSKSSSSFLLASKKQSMDEELLCSDPSHHRGSHYHHTYPYHESHSGSQVIHRRGRHSCHRSSDEEEQTPERPAPPERQYNPWTELRSTYLCNQSTRPGTMYGNASGFLSTPHPLIPGLNPLSSMMMPPGYGVSTFGSTPFANSVGAPNPDGTANFFPFDPEASSIPQGVPTSASLLAPGFFDYFNTSNELLGVSPSDIDKYSRVVFPVCFVCFNLMYWVIYMHIRLVDHVRHFCVHCFRSLYIFLSCMTTSVFTSRLSCLVPASFVLLFFQTQHG